MTAAAHIYAGLDAAVKVLSSIEIITPPWKTACTAGEALDTSVMVVTAAYSGGKPDRYGELQRRGVTRTRGLPGNGYRARGDGLYLRSNLYDGESRIRAWKG
ncbi:MAG: hypothetical protein LBD55_13005 [Treponema sp.]|jgi:hypothetical protein|nr:hypothetical protein [Treponema sp.]